MEAVSPQQLETLKYSELQRLAKGAGLKANQKVRGRRAGERDGSPRLPASPKEARLAHSFPFNWSGQVGAKQISAARTAAEWGGWENVAPPMRLKAGSGQ